MSNPRIPPHSIEAETSVLGAILISKEGITKVAEFLRPEHFYDPAHQSIFQAILELYERREPLDIVTLAEQLKKSRKLSAAAGASILAELTDSVPTASHIEHYGRLVKDAWLKRQLIDLSAAGNELAFDQSRSTPEILDEVEQKIFALSQQEDRRGFISVKDALAESFDRLDELQRTQTGLRGVPSGFKDLDNALAGMQPSNLLILAARPGLGKTSLALNISQYASVTAGIPVGYFALEMSQEEMVDRMLIAQADVDAWKFKTGRFSEADFNKLSEAFGILAEAPMFIDDTPALSIMEMRTKARRLKAEHNVGLLVVDYLQLARSRNLENRVQEVSEISQGLKNLAREIKVPILALSQLSRAVEHRGTNRPQLADLRESGCLTADTEIIRADTGRPTQIADLVGKKNIPVLALNQQLKLMPAKISRVFSSGVKKVYLLKLRSGRTVKASANHPFLTLSGWKRLDQLANKDRIAVPREIKIDPDRESDLTDNQLIVLGHLIGDGCYLDRHVLQYTSSDLSLVKIVETAAKEAFNVKPRIEKQKSWFQLYLTSAEHLTHGKYNPVVKWLRELKIFNQRSFEKKIPEQIFGLSSSKIALFLRHLWATDGSVTVNRRQKGRKVVIYYATNSQILVHQVNHMLLRLGIASQIRISKKTGYRDMWNVFIQGKINQEKFLKQIGCVGEKEKIATLAIKILAALKDNPNVDTVPKDAWKIIEAGRLAAGLSTREFHRKLGWAYSGTQRHKNGLSRRRLMKVAQILGDNRLEKLAESDIFWDEISDIQFINEEQVYDATIPSYANFVANDIIVHNSIEQDSDVVMFLYRENEDDRENVTLDIQKHRNGPLRKLNLFFKGDRIRFFSAAPKQPTASKSASISPDDKKKK